MLDRRAFLLSTVLLLATGCAGTQGRPHVAAARPAAGPVVEFTILQFKDVYEIGALEGGKSGGLARVA